LVIFQNEEEEEEEKERRNLLVSIRPPAEKVHMPSLFYRFMYYNFLFYVEDDLLIDCCYKFVLFVLCFFCLCNFLRTNDKKKRRKCGTFK
jgi:hypothetical protein